MFVDSHCHLEDHRYDADRVETLARARNAGVEAVLAIGNGAGPGTFDCGIQVAEQLEAREGPRIYASVGIHPHEAKIADEAVWDELERLAQHPKVIAWGEIGLDYWYDFSPRETQREVFVRQMEMARASRRPIVIHCRPSKDSSNAWDDLLPLLKQHWAASGLGGILHCFGGTPEQMRAGLDMGFMISFAGNVSFPKADEIRIAAREAPLDRMLIETDSPYLAPVPHRGERNEPAYVAAVAQYIGSVRNISAEDLGAITAANFYRFFRLRP